MENLRRHFNFAGQNGKGSVDRSSVFHVDVNHKQDHGASISREGESVNAPLAPVLNGGQNSNQNALNVFIQCLCRYHGAGTQVREQLMTTLKGTLYEPLAAMCTTKLTPNLFEHRPDLLQIGNEVHRLLGRMQETPPKTEASQQAVLKCMLLLLKLDSLYHRICLEEVQSSINELSQACANHSCHDILNLITSLELTNQSSSSKITATPDMEMLPPISHGGHDSLMSVKDNNHTELNSTKLPPKQSSKSSIFNIFGRKNSPDEGKNNGSSFYVDIKSEGHTTRSSSDPSHQLLVDTGNGLSVSVTPPPSNDWNTHSALPLIPERLPSPGDKNKGSRSSQMASEEEIDSVINLLSGCTNSTSNNSSNRASPLMHTIPENKISPRLDVLREPQPPTGPAPSGGPVITNIPITVTHETDSLKLPPRTQLHRRSEGSIDFTERNTWPHQHRNPMPLGLQSGFYDPLPQEHLFGRRFSSEFQNRPRGHYGSHLLSNSHWLFPDSKLHQNWNTLSSHTSSQASGLATAGSDTMNSSWSGFQDSSDLSDDSSSGEQFFAVGLDLVNALDSKNDSSDDDCDRPDFYRDSKDHQRVRSLENLMDVKATHTWPPKQPWARSALVISEAMEASAMDNHHRPLQMQWSDPMSSRNVWGAAGLGPQLSHRSINDFGHLPH